MEHKTDQQKSTPEYEAPRIKDHGDLTELTAGRTNGSQLDAAFPVGTPYGDITLTTP